MYFASRLQAGRLLAPKLVDKYRYENCAVLAIDDGGVVVGAQIAIQLHCVLTLLMSAEINLPQEPVAVAGITSGGAVAYNPSYSKGELDEVMSENWGFIEQEKLKQMHELNQVVGTTGTVNKRLLNGHNIIIVSEGLRSGFQVDLAYEFLKPIAIERLIFAVPFATVSAVDRMHVIGDEIYCLNVLDDPQETNHYYEKNDIPDHNKILKTIEQIVLKWK
jgi:putative phosphoribosyl transferase